MGTRSTQLARAGVRPLSYIAPLILTLLALYGVLPASSASSAKPTRQPAGAWQVLAGDRTAPGQFNNPLGVAVDTEGNLYVADWQNHRLQKLSADGTSLAVWGTPGNGPGQFDQPAAVALDRQGNVYVADAGNGRIQKLSPSGQPLAAWGTAGSDAGQFLGPSSLAVDVAGNIYVADTGNSRI